ncbi:MAG: YkgJ family cysteine cluster protein [Candidatus Thorarchaeota archaeon]|jgi:Fe-S-cluster containining protein
MGRHEYRKICKECGGYCCSFGGTAVTKAELKLIIDAGHENHFVGVLGNCYVTFWGEEGICPYLRDSACSIYEVRPGMCMKFPILSMNNIDHHLVHCPLTEHLSEDEIQTCIEQASRCPDELFIGSNIYLEPHRAIIGERISKFRMDAIDIRKGDGTEGEISSDSGK